jgi:hypothetical protein
MAYSVMAQDARGVGQIADLLLHEYIAKGSCSVDTLTPLFNIKFG